MLLHLLVDPNKSIFVHWTSKGGEKPTSKPTTLGFPAPSFLGAIRSRLPGGDRLLQLRSQLRVLLLPFVEPESARERARERASGWVDLGGGANVKTQKSALNAKIGANGGSSISWSHRLCNSWPYGCGCQR